MYNKLIAQILDSKEKAASVFGDWIRGTEFNGDSSRKYGA
ncbi:hypothetical protein FHS10_000602 [Mucilaginibacter dorajii]|nr:hypothetical protein [Mucilaginibacter dorajii]